MQKEKAAGGSLKRRNPGLQARASGNEFNFEEEIVMANDSTVVTVDNLPQISHAGRLVVTTALLAQLYKTKPKNISDNYLNNASRFEHGKHFFKLEGAELKTFKNSPDYFGSVEKQARSLTLWTERGAARHAKMLDTDQAWDVYEKLEDCYFGKNVRAQALTVPASASYSTITNQTIGTDGFHMLGSVVKGKVINLPATIQRSATMKMWSQLHAAFGVRSAADIPSDQLDSARIFIAAYSVEGEWNGKAGKLHDGIHLDRFETQHLYLLMSRFSTMHKHKCSMLSAAESLGSKTLMSFFDQLHDGFISFSTLDKRRDEIYRVYSALGFEGGYAWRGAA